MGERRSRAEWVRIVAEADRGGSVESVARRHGVKPRTLSWWRWRLRRVQGAASEAITVHRMLPVVVPDLRAVRESYDEIVVEVREFRVRIGTGADVGYVASLVDALRTC